MAPAEQVDSVDAGTVRVSVPAHSAFLQLLRLNVAGIAGGIFTTEEIEDVKIAIEELAAFTMAAPAGEPELHVELVANDVLLVVRGWRALDPSGTIEKNEFLPLILDAVVDDYDLDVADDRVSFRFEKRTREQ